MTLDRHSPRPSARVRVTELRGADVARHEDRVVTEEPLEIRVAEPGLPARRITVTMRTPGSDFELAAGWLFHEGLIERHEDLARIAYCADLDLPPDQELNVVTADLRVPARRAPGVRYPGATAASSACGVCGAESIEEVFAALSGRPRPAQIELDAELLRALPGRMRERQRLFERTGGLHGAAIFSPTGDLLELREDVGRHNAVDKASGARLLAGVPRGPEVLVTSGRIGFEIVQKAVAASVTAVVAVGAPTSLAVDLANQAGLALLGWTRGDRTIVFSGAERVS